MSEFTAANCGLVPECAAPMPFELDAPEAGAVQGALSFLFTLITTYEELVKQNAAAGTAH